MDELDDVGAALGVCACEGDTDCVRLPLPVGLPVSVTLGLVVELALAGCDGDWEPVVTCDAVWEYDPPGDTAWEGVEAPLGVAVPLRV